MAFFRRLAKLFCYFIYFSSFITVANTPQAVYFSRKATCSTRLFVFEFLKAVAFAVVFSVYRICFFREDFPHAEVRVYMKVALVSLTLTNLLRLFYVLPANDFWIVVTVSILALFITRDLLNPRHLY
ncbi:hypothetical protein ACLB2K_056783 [Fragaria x ananassa]